MPTHLTIELSPDEANAVVESVCLALIAEADELSNASFDSPGDLGRLGRSAGRIGTLANLGQALLWRKHWGPLGGTPDPVTATEAVWVDLLGELNERADELRRCDVDDEDVFEFDTAARTVARAFAGASMVVA